MRIGDNIKQRRKALKISQDELADAIGANRVTISRYETGNYLPSVPALEKLAVALRTTTAQLTGGAEMEEQREQFTDLVFRDPNLKLLFDEARNAKPEHIKAAAAVLQSLRGK